MPTKRLTMRRIHRLMTLRFGAGAGTRVIARELGISHSTVREYLARIRTAGITWPLPAEITDQELEQQLFVNGGVRSGARHHVEPDWAVVARELKRRGVNLLILWEEYRANHSDGYAYSRYVASEFMLRRRPHSTNSALFLANAAHNEAPILPSQSIFERRQRGERRLRRGVLELGLLRNLDLPRPVAAVMLHQERGCRPDCSAQMQRGNINSEAT